MKRIVAPLTIALVTAGTIAATAAAAWVATPVTLNPTFSPSASSPWHGDHLGKNATLQQIQAVGASATVARITKVRASIARVDGDTTLAAMDRSTPLATLEGDATGMRHLPAAIAADTTTTQARFDFTTMFRECRVIDGALLQARMVRDPHRVTGTTLPRLRGTAQKLFDTLGKDQRADTRAAQNVLSDLPPQTTAELTASLRLATKSLALTPMQFGQDHTVTAKAKALTTVEQVAQKDDQIIRRASQE